MTPSLRFFNWTLFCVLLGALLDMGVAEIANSRHRTHPRHFRAGRRPQYFDDLRKAARPGRRMHEFVEASTGDRIDRLAEVYERLFRRWRYVSDPDGGDWLISAEDMLAEKESRGDCEDFAGLIAASLQAFPDPWPCRIVLTTDGREGHAFTEVKLGDGRVEADPLLQQLASRWKCDLLHLRVMEEDDGSIWLALDLDGPPVRRAVWRRFAVYPDSSRLDVYGPRENVE